MFVFLAPCAVDRRWEWNARTQLGLRAGDIDDSPQAWAEQRRARRCRAGDDRRRQPHPLRHRPRPLPAADRRPAGADSPSSEPTPARCSRTIANDPNFHGLLILGMADTAISGPPASASAATLSQELREKRQAVAADRPVARPFPPAASRIHGRRLSAEPSLPKRLDHGCRKGADSPYDDVWKISETFDRSAIFHVGPDRDATPICAATRATPGTCSRDRRCRRSSPAT